MMDKNIANALEKSIAHWEEIVSQCNEEGLPQMDISPGSCALCNWFFSCNCIGCPVKDATGESHCNKSPYMEFAAMYRQIVYYDLEYPGALFLGAMKLQAEKELEFLKSLRSVEQ